MLRFSELSNEQVLSQLKQVNVMLAESLKKYPSLYAKDLLQMAALVNSKIKGRVTPSHKLCVLWLHCLWRNCYSCDVEFNAQADLLF